MGTIQILDPSKTISVEGRIDRIGISSVGGTSVTYAFTLIDGDRVYEVTIDRHDDHRLDVALARPGDQVRFVANGDRCHQARRLTNLELHPSPSTQAA